MEVRNHNEIYQPNGLPFVVNGGADSTLVKGLHFASVPGARIAERMEIYRDHNAKIVSCNSHCVATALGLVCGLFADEDEFRSRVRDIDICYHRRHDDPHKRKPRPLFVAIAPRPHHIEEIEDLLPETQGMIETLVSKWPTEYFHNVVITIDFHDPVSPDFIRDLRYQFLTYPRCILVDDELSHQRTIDAARWARLDDGDVPFPLFLLYPLGRHKVRILALTPQRGIVAPSTADYVLLRTGRVPKPQSWNDIVHFVNANATYRGQTFSHIKNAIQDNLEKYADRHGRRGD